MSQSDWRFGIIARMIRAVRLRGCLLACAIALVSSSAFGFDIGDLRALVRQRKPTSVSEVVARLPKQYKENYTLVYHSRSLQGSSYDDPRAILFGRTARLILTFNGDPSEDRYNSIEVMQFRRKSESFELYSINFSDGSATVSGPDPRVCSTCHSLPPHPIWSSYEYGVRKTEQWPGVYGSSQDAPIKVPKERAAFERFRREAASNPRYRHLVMSKAGAPWFPYGTGPHQHRLRPNDRLGNLLARWQARQIVGLIERGSFARRHRGVAEAWLLRCPGIGVDPYLAKVRALFDARFPAKTHSLAHQMLNKLPGAEQAAFMMHDLLTDSDAFGWDMNIAEARTNGEFSTGIVTVDQLVSARWLATLDDDNWLKAYFKPWKSRQLYNTFAPGYYEANVEPGGVGRDYDEVMGYYDESRARLACPIVMRNALTATH